MALQSSGQIKFSDISLQFLGVSNVQTNLGSYYTNSTSLFTTGVSGLPTIGNPIKFTNFYSKSCILGSIVFTTIGNTSWTVPDGVNMISAVCIGGGGGATVAVSTTGCRSIGGGGGGALAYINKIRVTPRTIFTIKVGDKGINGNSTTSTAGGDSFITTNTANIIVHAGGGQPGGYISSDSANSTLGGNGGTVLVGFGGNGGKGADIGNGYQGYANYGGGGGAGGYTGNGGNGGNRDGGGTTGGQGGGGGGGWGAQSIYTNSTVGAATSGGGTAIFGLGNNGLASTGANINGGNGSTNRATALIAYGGGAGGRASGTPTPGQGVVRIVYGTKSFFPSTNLLLSELLQIQIYNYTYTNNDPKYYSYELWISGNYYYIYRFTLSNNTTAILKTLNFNFNIIDLIHYDSFYMGYVYFEYYLNDISIYYNYDEIGPNYDWNNINKKSFNTSITINDLNITIQPNQEIRFYCRIFINGEEYEVYDFDITYTTLNFTLSYLM